MNSKTPESTSFDRHAVLAVLPGPLRDAPPPVQCDWLRSRARQFTMLRVVAAGFGCIFFALGILVATASSGNSPASALPFVIAVFVSLWAYLGLGKARSRCLTYAKHINNQKAD